MYLVEPEKEPKKKPKVHFDYDNELKHGSKFYNFSMKQMKQKLIPAVMEELKSVDLPSFKDEIDAGKFGKIEFGLSDVLLKNINIPLEGVRYSLPLDY